MVTAATAKAQAMAFQHKVPGCRSSGSAGAPWQSASLVLVAAAASRSSL
jgi:hypothetical protein